MGKRNGLHQKMREFILENAIATESELDVIEAKCKSDVQDAKKNAWTQFSNPIKNKLKKHLHFAMPSSMKAIPTVIKFVD